MAKSVRESAPQNLAEASPLVIGKACVVVVRLGILQIDLLMGHVQVSAVDHGLGLLQLFDIPKKGLLPLHAVGQSGQFSLGIGHIDRHAEKLLIFCRDHPALAVVLLHPDAVGHLHRLLLGKKSCTRIAFLLRVIPVLVITRQLQLHLSCLQLRLLQTKNIRVHLPEKVHKPLLHTCPQAVHIP